MKALSLTNHMVCLAPQQEPAMHVCWTVCRMHVGWAMQAARSQKVKIYHLPKNIRAESCTGGARGVSSTHTTPCDIFLSMQFYLAVLQTSNLVLHSLVAGAHSLHSVPEHLHVSQPATLKPCSPSTHVGAQATAQPAAATIQRLCLFVLGHQGPEQGHRQRCKLLGLRHVCAHGEVVVVILLNDIQDLAVKDQR